MHEVQGYRLEGRIGRGCSSEVYKAYQGDKGPFAIKNVAELKIAHQNLKHANLVKVIETFTKSNVAYIVMELCEEGELGHYIVKNKPDINTRLQFLIGASRGLNFLHSQPIIHSDIRPEHLLITRTRDNLVCKIIKYEYLEYFVGSSDYMAPEVLNQKQYTTAGDVFSLGLIFFAVHNDVIVGNTLVPNIVVNGKHVNISKALHLFNDPAKEEEFIKSLFPNSREMGILIHKMLQNYPDKRPQMDLVLQKIEEIKASNDLVSDF